MLKLYWVNSTKLRIFRDYARDWYLINNYDTMELSPEFDDNKGNRAITIKKRINGVSVVATIEKGNNKEFLVTSYQFVKSDALDASNETPELNVRNDSDIAKVQKDIENIKSLLFIAAMTGACTRP